MLSLRSLLVAIILAATVLFVVGIVIERSDSDHAEAASAYVHAEQIPAAAEAVFVVREVFHQIDESKTDLVAIAGLVAGLHFAASGVAALMGREAARQAA